MDKSSENHLAKLSTLLIFGMARASCPGSLSFPEVDSRVFEWLLAIMTCGDAKDRFAHDVRNLLISAMAEYSIRSSTVTVATLEYARFDVNGSVPEI